MSEHSSDAAETVLGLVAASPAAQDLSLVAVLLCINKVVQNAVLRHCPFPLFSMRLNTTCKPARLTRWAAWARKYAPLVRKVGLRIAASDTEQDRALVRQILSAPGLPPVTSLSVPWLDPSLPDYIDPRSIKELECGLVALSSIAAQDLTAVTSLSTIATVLERPRPMTAIVAACRHLPHLQQLSIRDFSGSSGSSGADQLRQLSQLTQLQRLALVYTDGKEQGLPWIVVWSRPRFTALASCFAWRSLPSLQSLHVPLGPTDLYGGIFKSWSCCLMSCTQLTCLRLQLREWPTCTEAPVAPSHTCHRLQPPHEMRAMQTQLRDMLESLPLLRHLNLDVHSGSVPAFGACGSTALTSLCLRGQTFSMGALVDCAALTQLRQLSLAGPVTAEMVQAVTYRMQALRALTLFHTGGCPLQLLRRGHDDLECTLRSPRLAALRRCSLLLEAQFHQPDSPVWSAYVRFARGLWVCGRRAATVHDAAEFGHDVTSHSYVRPT